ncbi:MAG: ABC-type transport auxiliary lipoprotein family protein [Planctomycetota bacterium]|nr:ABC-type transport auxiliary lipoprotein family protein [Planctomycetota bacterium]
MITKPSVAPYGLLFLALVTGCVSLERAYPEKKLYSLEASRTTRVSPKGARSVLRVNDFQISPGYEKREFVYRVGDNRYESDFYRLFFTPPSRMVTSSVRDWLANSGLFGNVVGSGSLMESDYVLEGSVQAMYGDYRGGQPKAVLKVQTLLLREGERGPVVVRQKNFEEAIPIGEEGGDRLVKGWNTGLKNILKSLEGELKGLDLKATPGS